MPGFKESSILFSLQGLMDRERERIDQEKLDRLRAIEQANQVRLDRDRRQQEEEDRRVREAHERALREETQRREHQARLEAMKRVEVERVRADAESRSRLETVAMQQEHERRMAAIELESRVRRFRALAVGGVVFSVATLAGAASLYLGKIRPEQARMESAYSQLVSSQQTAADDAQRLLERQKQKNDKLAADLGAAQRQLDDARRDLAEHGQAKPAASGGHAAPAQPAKPRGAAAPGSICTGDPNDPMNGCLK